MAEEAVVYSSLDLDMKWVKYKAHPFVKDQAHGLVMGVCPVRLAEDDYTLEETGEEGQRALE